jgi:hypothetical protein
MLNTYQLHAAAVVLCYLVSSTQGQEKIVGCDGLLNLTPELENFRSLRNLPKVDYSHAKVELLAASGSKLQDVGCSPVGYYFMQINEPGTYILRPVIPEAWSLQPEQREITCTATSCNGGKEVHFSVAGFPLEASIAASPDGPGCKSAAASISGVTIRAFADSTKQQVAVTTSVAGLFSFHGLQPGSFTLRAEHPDWQLHPAEAQATVGWGTASVHPAFRIDGYSLGGTVSTPTGPASGVVILLTASQATTIGCSSTASGIPNLTATALPEASPHLVCTATSDATGHFK